MVPFTSPGPAGGGPPGPPGPPGPGPWAESEPAARRRPSAAERVGLMTEALRQTVDTDAGGLRGAVPPTWALRPGFREVSDRVEDEMVCCRCCKPFEWTILRSRRRMDAERVDDRARSGRSRALLAHSHVSFEIAHWSVARGYSGGRLGLTRCEPVACGAGLLLRPERPPPHPRAPSRLATWTVAARGGERIARTHDLHYASFNAVGPHPSTRVACPQRFE